MPKVKSGDLNKLIESYSTDLKREICIATNKDGVQGHPVLFGSKFFMQLVNLKGDKGAKPKCTVQKRGPYSHKRILQQRSC